MGSDPGDGNGTAKRPLRVALYTPAWPRGALPNGIVTYVASIVPALRERGIEVFVMAGRCEPDLGDPRVSVPAPVRDSAPLRAFSRLREWVSPGFQAEHVNARAILSEVLRLRRTHAVELVEMEESFGWCGSVASRCGIPVIARLHGPWFLNGAMDEDPTAPDFRRRVRTEGRALARVAALSAPSRDVLDRTRARYRVVAPITEVIPNPMPPSAGPSDGASSAEQWQAGKCEPGTVLFVGRFDNHKGGDVAIEAFARIRSQQPGARLLFAGPDAGLTDPAGRTWHLREFLADRLPREEDRAAVEVLGRQPPDVIHRLRLRAAVTIVSSRFEVLAYTVIEAMGLGCPLVSTSGSGPAELVEDGRNGLLVRPADPDDLARAVLRLLRDPELAARLGRAAAQMCATRLAPATIAAQTEALYRRVLSERTSS